MSGDLNNTHPTDPKTIAAAVKSEVHLDPTYRLSNRLLGLILAGIITAVFLGLMDYNRRGQDADRSRERLLQCEKNNSSLEVALSKESELSKIAATQEAEGSVLTKLGRSEVPTPRRREIIDVIKALTRRYILLNASFKDSQKTPELIIQELCKSYAEKGAECY